MRVTLLAPLVTPLRAAQTGGAQAVVAALARGLAAAGEEVEVVAAPGSRLPGVPLRVARGGPFPGELLSFAPTATPQTVDDHASAWPARQAAAYLRAVDALRADPPAVVHSHALDWPPFYALAAAGLPTVHTLHLGPLDAAAVAAARAAAATHPRPRFVAVSRACAAQWRGLLPVDAVVGNGADPALIPLSLRPEPDLAVVAGRIAPEKGTHLALRAARRLGLRTLLVGDVYDSAYFTEKVAPLLGADVERLGPVPSRRLARLYGRAAVALVASLWEEPFGMVALEANLAGTPVAGFARGGLPEVVGREGGVLSEQATVAGLAAAARAAMALDRRRVRRAAERRHSLDRMVQAYREIYADLAGPG